MIASCPDDHELQREDMSPTRSTARSGGVRSLKRLTADSGTDDYAAFEAVLEQAREQVDLRLLAFCVLPNQAVQVVSDSGTGAQPWHLPIGLSAPARTGWTMSLKPRRRRNGRHCGGAPRLALPSAKRSGSRPRRSVWDWNPRYVPLAAQNASVPTGERSHDAANRPK
jgi:hypothetical protein